ncbi:Oidioi.mRNA.OKI2018_I69.chr2.g5143.t1.cds [Oikopleura dioica]|uniref:Oidioi.mRNA.OKI2018_I69.chr2.g5143.t1.cds n=1 Tax=Oikopleura dioica TaxID=34765 RepID=A0ABN7T161_OIKDI|nr:Oidioi.mRNA.OKI2018_I69.chr2.g5143.t1.cds [Oikopleura dioica]
MNLLLAGLFGMTVAIPASFTDQFDDYFEDEEEDLKNPGTMSAGRVTGSGVVNSAFVDAMAEFLLDEPELAKQTFEEPLDYSFDYDDEDAFAKWMARQG